MSMKRGTRENDTIAQASPLQQQMNGPVSDRSFFLEKKTTQRKKTISYLLFTTSEKKRWIVSNIHFLHLPLLPTKRFAADRKRGYNDGCFFSPAFVEASNTRNVIHKCWWVSSPSLWTARHNEFLKLRLWNCIRFDLAATIIVHRNKNNNKSMITIVHQTVDWFCFFFFPHFAKLLDWANVTRCKSAKKRMDRTGKFSFSYFAKTFNQNWMAR